MPNTMRNNGYSYYYPADQYSNPPPYYTSHQHSLPPVQQPITHTPAQSPYYQKQDYYIPQHNSTVNESITTPNYATPPAAFSPQEYTNQSLSYSSCTSYINDRRYAPSPSTSSQHSSYSYNVNSNELSNGISPFNSKNWSSPHSRTSKNGFQKRSRQDSEHGEPNAKKKKKKPLSKSNPQVKAWSIDDAKVALELEEDFNKKRKSQIIIHFPDLEINKEIVSNYHAAIANVHFQRRTAKRFCFVTLNDNADPDDVIKHLNTIPFGAGHLTAELKKYTDDKKVGPEEIDPLTLYVGNLGQEITSAQMYKIFPNAKRVDIGYAKKMKFTRYAFVAFHTLKDSTEAFKSSHNIELFSQSIIVRFRRLNGQVGMPGETKVQNLPDYDHDADVANEDDTCHSFSTASPPPPPIPIRPTRSTSSTPQLPQEDVRSSSSPPATPPPPLPATPPPVPATLPPLPTIPPPSTPKPPEPLQPPPEPEIIINSENKIKQEEPRIDETLHVTVKKEDIKTETVETNEFSYDAHEAARCIKLEPIKEEVSIKQEVEEEEVEESKKIDTYDNFGETQNPKPIHTEVTSDSAVSASTVGTLNPQVSIIPVDMIKQEVKMEDEEYALEEMNDMLVVKREPDDMFDPSIVKTEKDD